MRDHSCFVSLQNNLDVELTLLGFGTGHGHFASLPSESIAAGDIAPVFHVKDSWGAHGSEGWVQYRVELPSVSDLSQRPVMHANFGDPSLDRENWYTANCRDGIGNALLEFSNTTFGRTDPPLIVTGVISYKAAIDTGAIITALRMPKPVLNVYNTKVPPTVHRTNGQLIWDSDRSTAYEDNDSTTVAGSFSPVTVDMTREATVDVTMGVDESLVGVPFYIRADLGEDEKVIYHDVPQYFTSTGPQTIQATVKPSWQSATFPWALVGDLEWKLHVPSTGQLMRIATTRLEIYGLTKNLPKYFANVIDVGFLRSMIIPARHSGETDWIAYVIKITFESYGAFRFRYDTRYGASHFGPYGYGGNFDLRSWVRQSLIPNTVVNCYDQAGIFQIGLGLSPHAKSTWKFLSPFGYITQTNLIGVGLCNNPFYESNGSTALTNNNDMQRTAFGNHCFVAVASTEDHIADACAGPHVVSETVQGYIAAAVQQAGTGPNQTTLYGGWFRPGTENDLRDGYGIVSLNKGAPSIMELEAVEPTDEVTNAMRMASITGWNRCLSVNIDLSAIHTHISSSNLAIVDHSHHVYPAGSEINYALSSTPYPTSVHFVILSSPVHALLYFQFHLSKYSRPLSEIFAPGPINQADSALCLTSSPEIRDHGLLIWAFGNIFAYVAGPMSIDELNEAFAQPLHKIMLEGRANVETLHLPVLRYLRAPTEDLKVGQEFVVSASVEQCTTSSFHSQTGNIILLSQDPATHSFRLRAEVAGVDMLVFAFAHVTSGKVVSREVKVTVVA
ncbi:hypothetical protein MMC30_003847 [Trapelia coarctata]|nr:hypothetical protein [Trapelia coarctata]